jgi:hypothetical protein
LERSTPESLKAGIAVSSISWSGKRGHHRGWDNVQCRDAERKHRRGGESEEEVGGFAESEKTAARKERAEKRNEEPSVGDDWCLPISAASRKQLESGIPISSSANMDRF